MKTQNEKMQEINGSGLFFFKTSLSVDEQYKMLEWYNSLSKTEQGYVDAFRSEATSELTFLNC